MENAEQIKLKVIFHYADGNTEIANMPREYLFDVMCHADRFSEEPVNTNFEYREFKQGCVHYKQIEAKQ